MPSLTPLQWTLAVAGALGMGISKSGFPGMSLVHVVVFALIFGARNSTGIILPMLIAADVFAVRAYRQHARWVYIRRMLPASVVGIVVGFALMGRLNEAAFGPLIGVIVLVLTVLQVGRMARPICWPTCRTRTRLRGRWGCSRGSRRWSPTRRARW
jgi:uncharacterized membrane protein YfcA